MTDDPQLTVRVKDDRIYSYKVVAANDGGISFPSEILSLCDTGTDRPQVLIVNR